jgi:alpha-ketoglutarate-dependent taurine dioxygenase
MPGIITHPVTGVDSFGFSSSKFTIVADDMSLESEYRDFIQDYLNTLDNWITWEWEEGKCIIWDNFNLLHTYSAGWKNGERVFSRLQAGFSVPFYRLGLND